MGFVIQDTLTSKILLLVALLVHSSWSFLESIRVGSRVISMDVGDARHPLRQLQKA